MNEETCVSHSEDYYENYTYTDEKNVETPASPVSHSGARVSINGAIVEKKKRRRIFQSDSGQIRDVPIYIAYSCAINMQRREEAPV